MIDVKPNDVVYIRDNGVVRALKVKLIEMEISYTSTNDTSIYLDKSIITYVDPTGKQYKHSVNHPISEYFYDNLEDAINGRNHITKLADVNQFILDEFKKCFKDRYVYTSKEDAKKQQYPKIKGYKWDGYAVKTVYKKVIDYIIAWSDGYVSFSLKKPDYLFCATPEEAHKGHETTVIDF